MRYNSEYNRIKIPMASISPSGVCLYNQWIGPRRPRRTDDDDEIATTHRNTIAAALGRTAVKKSVRRPESNDTQGVMSDKALKRIENALKWLLFMSPWKKIYHREEKRWVKFRLCFVTLTLPAPQQHDDRTIKHDLLYQLLDELRKDCDVEHYVWRAEKQANGSIHFHLIVNKFIPHTLLRIKWNRIVNKLGYVDRYQAKMQTAIHDFGDYYRLHRGQGSYEKLLKRYHVGRMTNWTNPNTIDIHSVVKIRNLAAYLGKYIAKDLKKEYARIEDIPDHLRVKGRLWGLSQSLSQLKNVTTEVTQAIDNDINTIINWAKEKVFYGEHFTWIRIDFRQLLRLHCTAIMECVYRVMAQHNERFINF